MAFVMDKEMFKQFEKKGKKKIINVGGSRGITLPYWLFQFYWGKDDYLDVYLVNPYTIVLVNKSAKERKEKQDENKIKVESKDEIW